MYAIELLTENFVKWIGYCEKNNVENLGIDLNNPENYTLNAGYENNTIFAKVYEKMTGISVQGQPWCDTFIDTIFIHIFGVEIAKKLLGGFSAYTPTSAIYFKKMDRYYTTNPQEGDIIFFKNSIRIYHTGYIVKYDGEFLSVVEGNTSTEKEIVENGGFVVLKRYKYKDILGKIDGFGRPNYINAFEKGWKKAADNIRYWYLDIKGNYLKNGLFKINGLRYFFDEKGYMKTGQIFYNGERYYFLDKFIEGAELKIFDESEDI